MNIDQVKALQDERKMWSIHQSLHGATYYYNKVLSKSQWEIPDCLKSEKQLRQHPQWKECCNAQGKTFYHNLITKESVWEMPEQLRMWRECADLRSRRKVIESFTRDDQEMDETTRIDLQEAFKNALREAGTKSHSRWEQILSTVGQDERFKKIGIRERKQIFQAHIKELKDLQKEESRLKTQIHRQEFEQMLRERKLTSEAKYYRVKSDFYADPRWRALEEDERVRFFQEFMDNLFNKEKDQQKQHRIEYSEAFRRQLDKKGLAADIRWKTFKEQYENHSLFKKLSPVDQVSVYTDYIQSYHKKQDQEQKIARKAEEKEARIQFRLCLIKLLCENKISHKSKWRDTVGLVKSQIMEELMMQSSSLGHEIFQDLLEEIRKIQKSFKTLIKEFFKEEGFWFHEQTTREEFDVVLKKLERYTNLFEYQKAYIYSYFHHKVTSKMKIKPTQQSYVKDLRLQKPHLLDPNYEEGEVQQDSSE